MDSTQTKKLKINVSKKDCSNHRCNNGYVDFERRRKGGYEKDSEKCTQCSGKGYVFIAYKEDNSHLKNFKESIYSTEDIKNLSKKYEFVFL